jgi:hypothetical protein
MILTAVSVLWDWDEKATERSSLAAIVSERIAGSNYSTSYNLELTTQGELSEEGLNCSHDNS